MLVGVLLCWGTWSLAGCEVPPAPYEGCVADADCPGGRCVAGRCAPADDAGAAGGEDAADDALGGADTSGAKDGLDDDTAGGVGDTADAGQTCVQDEDCVPPGPCLAPVCSLGRCQWKPTEGASCLTAGVCPAPGICTQQGSCAPNEPACSDGNPCTSDACIDEVCNHAPLVDGSACELDGLPCTFDRCIAGECASDLLTDWCLISGKCYAGNSVSDASPCLRCLPETDAQQWTATDGAPCDDKDACSRDDVCIEAVCAGDDVVCDDGDVCTDDLCLPAIGCSWLPNTAPCDDGDPCTEDDSCLQGGCVGGDALDCDDENPCTADTCTPGLGCTNTAIEGTCKADGDPCTDDVCWNGSCVAIPSVTVCKIGGFCIKAGEPASGSPCLICDPTANATGWTLKDAGPCDDNNACTGFDQCGPDGCVGQPITCDDGEVCTNDSCLPGVGCLFKPAAGACDDGDACTLSDQCVGGACLGAQLGPVECDDGNPCTVDVCHPAWGCTHPPGPAGCDDGDPCTVGDTCIAGVCVGGLQVCQCSTDEDCDDGNPCTTAQCGDNGACSVSLAAGPIGCDDGSACTVDDKCAFGECGGLQLDCDDGNPCTVDGCVAEAGCVGQPLAGQPCNDGDGCTVDDFCTGGACLGVAKPCDDGNPCTADSCVAADGTCVHQSVEDGAACDGDGVPCTVDACIGGSCSHATIKPGLCLIEGACIAGGGTHPGVQCLGCAPNVDQHAWSGLLGKPCVDGDACTVNSTCDATGACLGSPTNCDDGNPCTKDGCDPSASPGDACVHITSNAGCDDGSPCSILDACNAFASCVGIDVDCNDGNPCTLDTCSDLLGCIQTPVPGQLPCATDGIACTNDVCIGGVCSHPVDGASCLIGGVCYTGGETAPGGGPCLGCAPATNPIGWSSFDGQACDDGQPCTGADVCAGGVCVGDAAAACDDGNPCTDEVCSPTSGCAFFANNAACDDGNACTAGDTCNGGQCKPGETLDCAGLGAGPCQIGICDPAVGCEAISTCGPLHECVSGLCLTTAGDGEPAAVNVPVPPAIANAPRRPTVAWQLGHEGKTGEVPQLWLAAQDDDCDLAVGSTSRVWTASFPPGADLPVFTVPSPPGPGLDAWCAGWPEISAHPHTDQRLLLRWHEGDPTGSGCSWTTTGGLVRVALVGAKGADVQIGLGSSCPAPASAALPLPSAVAWSTPSAPGFGFNSLAGVLVRPAAVAPRIWTGAPATWGGPATTELINDVPAGYLGSAVPTAPVVLEAGALRYALHAVDLDSINDATEDGSVVSTAITAGGAIASGVRRVQGLATPAGTARYLGFAAAWDPDAARVGVLVSARRSFGGGLQGAIAFARFDPAGNGGPQAPALLGTGPVAVGAQALKTYAALRIVEIPSSPDFLVLWVDANSGDLVAVRLVIDSDGAAQSLPLGSIAANFAGHGAGVGELSGTLSAIAIDPDGGRYTVAWETDTSVALWTAPLP